MPLRRGAGSVSVVDPQPTTLNERRKAATQMDIARAAAKLFTAHSAKGTTAEEIARAAGVAPRTFYRYFRTKEDAVSPLLRVGAANWRDLLAQRAAVAPVHSAIEEVITMMLGPTDDDAVAQLVRTLRLVRAASTDPALMAVWYRVNGESESELVTVLKAVVDDSWDDIDTRLLAAAATDAIRIGFEVCAQGAGERGQEALADVAVRCFRRLTPPD